MFNFTFKTLKIGFLILLPFLLVSNSNLNPINKIPEVVLGSYELQISGEVNQEIKGTARYTSILKGADKGNQVSTFSLRFLNPELTTDQTIEFLISQKRDLNILIPETYKITKNIEGFLNDFEGVFGFATINSLGEKPFFTKKGKVVIKNTIGKGIKGTIDVSFVDSTGREIFVVGNFYAVDENVQNNIRN